MKFKSNLHCHTNDDPEDVIVYSPYEAIAIAAENGFQVLSFACHNHFSWKKEYEESARDAGILLIPGIEKSIEKKHVLILNADSDTENIETFTDLDLYKKRRKDIFIIAPHPFFPSSYSLGNKFLEHISLFDAVEYSWFHSKRIDFNKKAYAVAKKNALPYVATSDTHDISFINASYAIIESEEKSVAGIFDGLRKKRVENISRELSITKEMIPYLIERALSPILLKKVTRPFPHQSGA